MVKRILSGVLFLLLIALSGCGAASTAVSAQGSGAKAATATRSQDSSGKQSAKPLPAISSYAKQMAISTIEGNGDPNDSDSQIVKNASIAVRGDQINCLITLKAMINGSYGKDLADRFVRQLSSWTSINPQDLSAPNSDNLTGPSNQSYGSLYNYYDVTVTEEYDPQDIFGQSTMKKGSQNLVWFQNMYPRSIPGTSKSGG